MGALFCACLELGDTGACRILAGMILWMGSSTMKFLRGREGMGSRPTVQSDL